jgi:hypothetical protein
MDRYPSHALAIKIGLDVGRAQHDPVSSKAVAIEILAGARG